MGYKKTVQILFTYVTGFRFYVAWNQTPVGGHLSITSACSFTLLRPTNLISRRQHFFKPTLNRTSVFIQYHQPTHPSIFIYFCSLLSKANVHSNFFFLRTQRNGFSPWIYLFKFFAHVSILSPTHFFPDVILEWFPRCILESTCTLRCTYVKNVL